MNLAVLSIRYPLYVGIACLICVVGGWMAYQNMPRFEDPEFTIRIAKVFTRYPGATAEEVMNEVTEPLETALQQLPEVKTIDSVSSTGVSEISVELRFDYSKSRADLQVAWTKVRNYVNDAQSDLPPGAGPSVVYDDYGDVYGIYYLLTGPGYSPAELSDVADQLRRELLLVDGVSKVRVNGERDEVIYVEVSRPRAASMGISLNQIYQSLSEQNTVAPAGRIRLGDTRVEISPTGSIDSVSAIESVLVGNSENGTVVRLGDIADVTRGYDDPVAHIIRFNGEPALGIGISRISGQDEVKLGQAVAERLEAA